MITTASIDCYGSIRNNLQFQIQNKLMKGVEKWKFSDEAVSRIRFSLEKSNLAPLSKKNSKKCNLQVGRVSVPEAADKLDPADHTGCKPKAATEVNHTEKESVPQNLLSDPTKKYLFIILHNVNTKSHIKRNMSVG